MSQSEKVLSWILKGGLLATPFIVLLVTRSIFFPFITGKNFAFRILVELLAVVWVYAALRFPRFRPRSSLMAWAVVIFIAVMGAATIFSISPYRSFWSNFERMEGYIGLLHLFLYFLLLSSVFTAERDWRIFFHTSLAASVIVAFYAALQLAGRFTIHQGGTRVDASLGNATYLAAYLLFHLFFLLWFFLQSEKRWWKAGYAAVFLFEVFILYHTATRGAILGLLGGLFLLGVFLAIAGRGTMRRFAAWAIGVAVLLPAIFFLVKDASFVRKSDVLSRFSAISPTEVTTQARFTIWKMAFKGWEERPILGWGQESFTYVFSKYYEPSLWRQEPWFDRAHNVFLDWLISGGILGLAAYLAMYAAAGWVLFRSLGTGSMGVPAVGVLGSLLAAHFFENLFVFDNLVSYLLFFAVLACLHAASSGPALAGAPQAGESPRGRRRPLRRPASSVATLTVTAGAVAAFLAVFFFANVKPMLAGRGVIESLKLGGSPEAAGKVDAVIASFRRNIDRRTFGTMELREQLSQVANTVAADQSLAAQDKAKFFEFAVSELEAQRRAFPYDMRAKAFLATLYTASGRSADAIVVVNDSLAVSSRRPQVYFIAAEAYIRAGKGDLAIDAVRRAYELAPDYPEAITNYGVILIVAGREQEAEALLTRHYGAPFRAEERFANAYLQVGRFAKAATVWRLLSEREPNDFRWHASYGVALARSGRAAEGIRAIERAIELEPRFRAQGESVIQGIKGGQIR